MKVYPFKLTIWFCSFCSRQVSMIVLLAQIGSYVPAERMCFSPFDAIYTRYAPIFFFLFFQNDTF